MLQKVLKCLSPLEEKLIISRKVIKIQLRSIKILIKIKKDKLSGPRSINCSQESALQHHSIVTIVVTMKTKQIREKMIASHLYLLHKYFTKFLVSLSITFIGFFPYSIKNLCIKLFQKLQFPLEYDLLTYRPTGSPSSRYFSIFYFNFLSVKISASSTKQRGIWSGSRIEVSGR